MSIREKVKGKKYEIEIILGRNGNKKIRHTETFYGQKREAQLREADLKLKLSNNLLVKRTKLKLADLLNEFMEYSRESRWTNHTYVSNRAKIQNIINEIGYVYLCEINVKLLEKFYSKLRKYKTRRGTYFSDKTIQEYYVLISTALDKAIDWGYIAVNPNKRIEKPKARRKQIECYSPDEVDKLLECVNKECPKYKAIIYLALDTGARRSELTGLNWSDINFKNHSVNINKSTQYVTGVGIVETKTKTETSDRKIYISEATINILKEYKREQNINKLKLGSKWGNSTRVFQTDYGHDIHPDTLGGVLEKIIKKYNLKKIKFHALRHTSVSLLISQGVQVQVISKKVGHANVTTTHTIYSHFFDEEFKQCANVMDCILSKKKAN